MFPSQPLLGSQTLPPSQVSVSLPLSLPLRRVLLTAQAGTRCLGQYTWGRVSGNHTSQCRGTLDYRTDNTPTTSHSPQWQLYSKAVVLKLFGKQPTCSNTNFSMDCQLATCDDKMPWLISKYLILNYSYDATGA